MRRLGLNLGAPGDRRADDGTLWLEYPSVGGPSPAVSLRVVAENRTWFRRHSSQVRARNWVAASGLKGVRSVAVPLSVSGPQDPTVWHWIGQSFIPAPVGPTPPLVGVAWSD